MRRYGKDRGADRGKPPEGVTGEMLVAQGWTPFREAEVEYDFVIMGESGYGAETLTEACAGADNYTYQVRAISSDASLEEFKAAVIEDARSWATRRKEETP